MPDDAHHREALIETARQELSRAHQAALTMSAGEIRRGLELALGALRDMPAAGPAAELDTVRHACVAKIEKALIVLDAGALSELGNLIEQVRKALETI